MCDVPRAVPPSAAGNARNPQPDTPEAEAVGIAVKPIKDGGGPV